jgi:hypothetical protein
MTLSDLAVDFDAWVTAAKPGDRFAYHYGLLIVDRASNSAVDRFAKEVWEAYEQGFVHLVQERRHDRSIYLAIRTEAEYG